MNDEQWEKIQARREQAAYFAGLELAAEESQKAGSLTQARAAERAAAKEAREREAAEKRSEKAAKRRERAAAEAEARAARAAARAAAKEAKEALMAERLQRRAERAENRERKPRPVGRPRFEVPACCVECGRPMRVRGVPKAERPDTVLHFAGGVCNSCHYGQASQRERTHDGSTSCDECGIRLRATGTTLAEAPGTRTVASKLGENSWLCATCHGRRRDGHRKQVRRPDNCVECGIGMTDKKVIEPGKRQHAARGLCTTCMSRQWRAARAKPLPPLGPCSECDTPMVRGRRGEVPEGHRRHGGKGKCSRCHSREAWHRRAEARM